MGFWDKFERAGEEDYEINNEYVIEAVKKAGYEVLEATDTQLLLDIDSQEQYELFLNRFDLFIKFFNSDNLTKAQKLNLINCKERPSIGGLPKRHIIIELPEPMPILERIAWQAAMGSDPKKEFNNLLGIHFGIPHHIVLFNKKKEEMPKAGGRRSVG